MSVRETLAPREWTALDCTQMTVGANCRYKASDAKSVSGTGSRRYEYESRGRRPRSGTAHARPRRASASANPPHPAFGRYLT